MRNELLNLLFSFLIFYVRIFSNLIVIKITHKDKTRSELSHGDYTGESSNKQTILVLDPPHIVRISMCSLFDPISKLKTPKRKMLTDSYLIIFDAAMFKKRKKRKPFELLITLFYILYI